MEGFEREEGGERGGSSSREAYLPQYSCAMLLFHLSAFFYIILVFESEWFTCSKVSLGRRRFVCGGRSSATPPPLFSCDLLVCFSFFFFWFGGRYFFVKCCMSIKTTFFFWWVVGTARMDNSGNWQLRKTGCWKMIKVPNKKK